MWQLLMICVFPLDLRDPHQIVGGRIYKTDAVGDNLVDAMTFEERMKKTLKLTGLFSKPCN